MGQCNQKITLNSRKIIDFSDGKKKPSKKLCGPTMVERGLALGVVFIKFKYNGHLPKADQLMNFRHTVKILRTGLSETCGTVA